MASVKGAPTGDHKKAMFPKYFISLLFRRYSQ